MSYTTEQSTENLIDVVEILNKVDFEGFMGSGIVFQIHGLDGVNVVPGFMIDGEDMEIIKVSIVESLVKTLRRRKDDLKRTLKRLEDCTQQTDK